MQILQDNIAKQSHLLPVNTIYQMNQQTATLNTTEIANPLLCQPV